MSDDTRLTPAERASPLWKKLEKIMEDRLDLNRRKLEADQDERDTAKLRGRNLELKFLLALAEDPPNPAQSADADY